MALRMYLRFVCLALAMLTLTKGALAQEKPFYLHNGDKVVFYGDSITEQRYYTYWVEVYTATRFPQMQVEFFNAGVGGDTVYGGGGGPIDVRLARDLIAEKPTVVTIMLGMNDGGYKLLDAATETRYTQGYEHVLDAIQQGAPGVRMTLLGPSPYDEVTRPETFVGGYNPTLVRFSAIDAELAQKRSATYIDLNAPFVAALKRGAAIDPLATELLLPDRVHPEQLAHWFMAAALLKGWNAPAIVSAVTIDAKQSMASDVKNAQVSDLHGDDGGVSWTELDGSLPLPLDDNNAGNHFLRQLISIDDDLNQQPLKITGLKPGGYDLNIDGHSVGKFTDLELEKGINLAKLNTPMRGQAYSVEWIARDRDETHYVRMQMLINDMKSGASSEKAAAELTAFEQIQQKQIYAAAQPKPHKFNLKAIATMP